MSPPQRASARSPAAGPHCIKATAGEVFSATANLIREEPATTRAAQQSLCREIQLRMPVPGTELTLLAAREVDSQTSALLLTAPDGLMALCDVFNGTVGTQVKFTIANHPIYDPLIERKDTSTSVHKAVVLVRRFAEDAGRGRVVLSNGQKVPMVSPTVTPPRGSTCPKTSRRTISRWI